MMCLHVNEIYTALAQQQTDIIKIIIRYVRIMNC